MALKEASISKEELFKRLGYKPHSQEQWDAHNSLARFKIPTCGRRWGKTTFAGNEFTYKMFIPDTYWWIVGPQYSLAEKEFRIIYNNFVRKLGMRGVKGFKASTNVKQGDMRIELPWNTVLEVKSAERPDSLLGEGLDGVIMSEAARHTMETWQMYIEPALSDKRGEAIFPSTPRGYNWYQGLWMLGQDSDFGMYESWRFPSWTNPIAFPGGLDDPEIRRIKAQVSNSYFQQEYAAEFTAFEGQIYEDFNPDIHVRKIEYHPEWKNFQAFDFGFRDPFVCLDIMVDPMDNIYVWREYQVSWLSTMEHAQIIRDRENPVGYHVDGRYADPRGADEIATLMLHFGHIEAPVVPWVQGIEATKRLVKLQEDGSPKIFFDPDGCPNLIRQFEQLHHKQSKEGKNVKEGQHDYNDHGPDALRYFTGPYFVLGGIGHLSDVYGTGGAGTEATTFFQLNKGFEQDSRSGFRY